MHKNQEIDSKYRKSKNTFTIQVRAIDFNDDMIPINACDPLFPFFMTKMYLFW